MQNKPRQHQELEIILSLFFYHCEIKLEVNNKQIRTKLLGNGEIFEQETRKIAVIQVSRVLRLKTFIL